VTATQSSAAQLPMSSSTLGAAHVIDKKQDNRNDKDEIITGEKHDNRTDKDEIITGKKQDNRTDKDEIITGEKQDNRTDKNKIITGKNQDNRKDRAKTITFKKDDRTDKDEIITGEKQVNRTDKDEIITGKKQDYQKDNSKTPTLKKQDSRADKDGIIGSVPSVSDIRVHSDARDLGVSDVKDSVELMDSNPLVRTFTQKHVSREQSILDSEPTTATTGKHESLKAMLIQMDSVLEVNSSDTVHVCDVFSKFAFSDRPAKPQVSASMDIDEKSAEVKTQP
jgi:hypothetical protein